MSLFKGITRAVFLKYSRAEESLGDVLKQSSGVRPETLKSNNL